jgi:hypothetical protein
MVEPLHITKATYVEYKALRDELLKRIELRQNILSLTFSIATIFLTVGIGFGILEDDHHNSIGFAALCYPLVATFLALSWAQVDHRITDIGNYIKENIEKRSAIVFNWNEIPGIDNGFLLDFLKKDFGIDWVYESRIYKDNDKRIMISDISGKSGPIFLELNDNYSKMVLKINDIRTYTFTAIEEYDTINIYRNSGFLWEAFLDKYQPTPLSDSKASHGKMFPDIYIRLVVIANGGVFVVAQALAIIIGYIKFDHNSYFWALFSVDVVLLIITIMILRGCSVDMPIRPPEESPIYVTNAIYLP